MATALAILHKHGFTGVKKVIDARGKAQRLTVSAWDCKNGKPKSQDSCPAALAGQRRGRTLLVFHTRTYEMDDSVAIRWVNSKNLQDAIMSEDSTGVFPPGNDYFLKPPDRWKRCGSLHTKRGPRGTGQKQRRYVPRKRQDLKVRKWWA